ncbi:MAG: ABC transporter permease subunit [FCB group bacterium]|nr:ABC transporter permease subunit [FCB group bacterium]MBL7028738.1 ABC transporter permease subunit [Candidatus Neomarinimicrobiota bacterium]MBL7120658.1 ABC transporter permease subunit [Candidatus Neomarinimicrobiota bacterium]
MTTYFIRRILLMIPTFLGSTILIFVILQMAPGGPLERTIQQLQAGAMQQGESAGSVGDIMSGGSSVLPESALRELRRFYGFDKPVYQRYLIWLGIWPREIKHREVDFSGGVTEVSKNVGRGNYMTLRLEGEEVGVYDTDGSTSKIWKAAIDGDASKDGKIVATIFQTEFSGILTGNLGTSYTYDQPVTEVMAPRFKISMFFGLTGLFLSYIVCIPLGIRKALNHGSAFDFLSSVVVFAAYSIPGYALGAVLLVLLGGGSFWDIFPLGGFRSPTEVWESMTLWEQIKDQLWHAVLPIISWSIGSFAGLTILMKNSLLENISQDYIRTAFAKGLQEKRVIWVHAIRNSVIPIASSIGGVIGVVIAGSYLIEKVFNIDGFGKMGFQAILDRDYPITLGFLVIVVMIRLVSNILSDIALATVDPRIRFK